MILDETVLDLYAKNNFNVLLSGRPGVGKTEIIKSIFNNAFGEGNWAYFSAATMDAWTDFIGIPKAVTKNGKDVLELIPPARFADDNIQALFFDEFNRAPAKVRNAVMELIQFKSINGRKFENLKVIWAAINPHDEEGTYDVDKLDPAQLDRFQIQIDVPYKVDLKYLRGKHGVISKAFHEWWTSQDQEMKYKISPRRLEDGIKVHRVNGDLSHVFPKESNVKDLLLRISKISLDDEWKDVLAMSKDERESFFQNVSNVEKFKDLILADFGKFVDYIPHDYVISKFTVKNLEWIDATIKNEKSVPKAVVKEIEKTYNLSFVDALNQLKGTLPSNMKLDLNGKNVVITGGFSKKYKNGKLSRTDAEALLNRIGAKMQKAVNSNTDYLIMTDPTAGTTKAQDAQKYNVPILSEDDFHSAYANF